MNTERRLKQYYDFDETVLEAVTSAAAVQNTKSYEEQADGYGLADGPEVVTLSGSGRALEVLKLIPAADYDETSARIYHTPMGNPVSRNMGMRAMRMFAADPTQQLIVVGNPFGVRSNSGTLTVRDSVDSLRTKSLKPHVEPVLEYLENQKVRTTEQLGYSYGADKAAATAGAADEHGITVPAGVFVEPSSVAKRSLLALAQAFGKTNAPMAAYVEQTGSQPYRDVRSEDSMLGLVAYSAGLLRMTNIAIVASLAHGGFDGRVRSGLDTQPDMHVAIGWGTESELTDDVEAAKLTDRLTVEYGNDRIATLRLQGMHHAGGEDIDLHAAIMLQGLRR